MSELLQSVIATYKERPSAAILMSGTGSNTEALLRNEHVRDLYDIKVIFSDNPLSRGKEIAERYGLDYLEDPVVRFKDKQEREAYFEKALHAFGQRNISAALYAGFMKISSRRFCQEVPGVNVHPADLTITDENGQAKYRGMSALSDMRRAEGYVASTLHVADTPVDTGSVIALTGQLRYPAEVSDADCHNLLKRHEHVLYPEGLIMLGEGRVGLNDEPRRLDVPQ